MLPIKLNLKVLVTVYFIYFVVLEYIILSHSHITIQNLFEIGLPELRRKKPR